MSGQSYEVHAYLDRDAGYTSCIPSACIDDGLILVRLHCDGRDFRVANDDAQRILFVIGGESFCQEVSCRADDLGRVVADLSSSGLSKRVRYSCEIVIENDQPQEEYRYKTCDFYIVVI